MKNLVITRWHYLTACLLALLPGLSAHTQSGDLATYDLDGDGQFERVLYREIYKLVNGNWVEQDGLIVKQINTTSSNASTITGFGDFNEDGYIDFTTYAGIYLSQNNLKYIGYTPDSIDCQSGIWLRNNKTFVADVDNDGSMELLYGQNPDVKDFCSRYLKFGSNNTPLIHSLDVIDPDMKQYIPSFGTSLPSLGDGMFVGGTTKYPDRTEATTIDINGDGIMDVVTEGEFLIGTTDGTFLRYPITGTITLRDFNDDGLLDYVGYDTESLSISLFLTHDDGQAPTEVKLLSGIMANKQIYCFDFDRDGDVDILIPCDIRDNLSYLIVMENQGNGKFKRHENLIEPGGKFTNCIDFDGDGYYEVTYLENYQSNSSKVFPSKYVRINGVKGISEPQDCNSAGTYISNYRNDGIMYADGITPISTYVNQRPLPPSRPTISYDKVSSQLTISWGAGSDKESAAADLSYALRIGTTPESQDIVYSHALNDGRRRDLRDGNMGYAHRRVLDVSTWAKGRYYISVQSVDPNRLGSQFSDFAMFDKPDDPVGFDVAYSSPVSTCDMVIVTSTNPAARFDFGKDAVVIDSRTGKRTEYYVKYTTPGEKTVRLLDSDVRPQTLTVSAATYANEGISFDGTAGIPSVAIDFDGDGHSELLWTKSGSSPKYTSTKLFQQTTNPNIYTPIKKLWNSNMYHGYYLYYKYAAMDLNHDGLPDLAAYGTDQIFHLTNDGDMDGSAETITASNIYSRYMFDVDNDGYLDVCDDYVHINMGDNIHFTSPPYENKINVSDATWIDLNRDGLIDLIKYYQYYSTRGYFQFINDGHGGFVMGERMPDESSGGVFALFDSDDKVDIITKSEIIWGDGTTTPIPGYKIATGDYTLIADINNDGLDDIACQATDTFSGNNYNLIIYQLPDHQLRITRYDGTRDTYYIRDIKESVFFRDADNRMRLGSLVLKAANTRPEAPTGLRASRNRNSIVIEWDHARDAESSPWQMRYCVSMKRKDSDLYIFSPLNGGDDTRPLPQPYPYVKGNRFTIPLEYAVPGEYEVRIQALDAWMEQSPFSETLTLSVKSTAEFDMPTSTRVNATTSIELLTNTDVTPEFDGGRVVSVSGHLYTVVWDTPGVKTVSAGDIVQTITVISIPEGDFTITPNVYYGDSRTVDCPTYMDGEWSVTFNGGDASGNYSITRDESGMSISFYYHGLYRISHIVSDINGSYTYSHDVNVTLTHAPEIDFVSIDPETGKYTFGVIPGDESRVAYDVYKETATVGQFSLIAANIPIGDRYIDMTSSPAISSARYMVRARYADGGSSLKSEIHQPSHLMINKGMNGGWNLMWSRYEGHDIASYRIFRGTTQTNLTEITTVSGSLASWYDAEAPAGVLYYSIQPIVAENRSSHLRATATGAERSNVVSTKDARDVVYATSVVIFRLSESAEISETDNMQLSAYITPSSATIRNLNWTIEQGSEFAQVSQSGEVSIIPDNGDGVIVVKASTIDGSDLSATYTISYTAPEDAIEEVHATNITVRAINGTITIDGAAQGEQIVIRDIAGITLFNGKSDGDTVRYTPTTRGIYIITVGTISQKVIVY